MTKQLSDLQIACLTAVQENPGLTTRQLSKVLGRSTAGYAFAQTCHALNVLHTGRLVACEGSRDGYVYRSRVS